MTCPLCASADFSSQDFWLFSESPSSEPTAYYHCPFCDLIFLDPGLRPDHETERLRYLEHNNSPDDPGYVSYLKGFAEEALLPFAPPPARILDFGSGPVPVFADVLRDLGYSVEIYDPLFAPDSPLHRDVEYRDDKNRDEEAPEKRFDGITAVEVAEHLFSPRQEFEWLNTALRPGGTLSLRTLLHYSNRGRFESWWYRKDPTHVCFYSPRSFEVLAEILVMELIALENGRSVVLRKPK